MKEIKRKPHERIPFNQRRCTVLRYKWLGYSIDEIYIRLKNATKYLKNKATIEQITAMYNSGDLIINGCKNIEEYNNNG